MADISISGTGNPYAPTSYTVESNDKNTLNMTDYFQLLAVQLQNQDVTNPMDSSELMNQLTQMAMVQAMSSMTTAIDNTTAVNTQTYAAGLIGQEVSVAVTEENSYGQESMVGVKYGRVEYVNFTTGNPTFKLEGDPKEYQLSHLLGVGRVPDSFGGGATEVPPDSSDDDDAVEKLVDMIVDRLSDQSSSAGKPEDGPQTDKVEGDGKPEEPDGAGEGSEGGTEVEGSGSQGGSSEGTGESGVTGGSDAVDASTEGENVGGAMGTNPDAGNAGDAVQSEESESGAVSGATEAPSGGSTGDATE